LIDCGTRTETGVRNCISEPVDDGTGDSSAGYSDSVAILNRSDEIASGTCECRFVVECAAARAVPLLGCLAADALVDAGYRGREAVRQQRFTLVARWMADV
jgi:hypothetical protein